MFKGDQELLKHISESYTEITDFRIDDDHYNVFCDNCNVVRGFQVVIHYAHGYRNVPYSIYKVDLSLPQTIVLRCPVCSSFKMWLIYRINASRKTKGGTKTVSKYYRLLTIPDEGEKDIDELPDEYPALKKAFRQALRAQNANAHLAAAAMYRRALQVITRDVLGATPSKLANELKEVVNKPYKDARLTKDFQDVGYIVKEAGNQGAHPDKDPDLLDFTEQDARDLGMIFSEIIGELFIIPKAMRKLKEDFKARRKIA